MNDRKIMKNLRLLSTFRLCQRFAGQSNLPSKLADWLLIIGKEIMDGKKYC